MFTCTYLPINIFMCRYCGWSRRIHELLVINAVIFMETSPCMEYVHGLLRAHVDYEPVAQDFSDLAYRTDAVFKGNLVEQICSM